MKKFLIGITIVISAFIFNSVTEAAQVDQLSEEELDYLYNNLNFNEKKIEAMPLMDLKALVEGQAEIVLDFDEYYNVEEPNDFEIQPLDLTKSDVNLWGNVYKFNDSDVSGYTKFMAMSTFRWLKTPVWNLSDKIAIGLPTGIGIFYKTSNGNISGFSSYTAIFDKSNDKLLSYTDQYSVPAPGNYNINNGVASTHDLKLSLKPNQVNGGYVSQYFYIPNANTGKGRKANVQFEYGHRTVMGSVGLSFGVGGLGVGITPHYRTEILPYAEEFNY